MKAKHLLSMLLLAAAPLAGRADQLIPAGSVITCTVAEAKISSQTEHVGDPVLCQLGHTEVYGRATFPYGSYLVGHFAEYKDPGHFVGKGWMELVFDKLIVQPDVTVPINARVVATPGYKVDAEGKIHGNGHPVKDTVEWLIPVLWPLDIINLPRRGPRPVLKPETRLTLKVLDDLGIPTPQENAVRTPALISRVTPDEPTYQGYRQPQQNYAPPAPAYQPPPQQAYAPAPQYAPQPVYQQPVYAQPVYVPAPPVVVVQSAPVIVQQPQVVVQQSPVVVQQQAPVYYRHYYPY